MPSMARRLVPALLLVACGSSNGAPRPTSDAFAGDPTKPNYNGAGSSGGGGGQGMDGGINPAGGTCTLPIGQYSYASRADGGTDCSQFNFPNPTVVYTRDHTYVPANATVGNCTITTTDITNAGCTLTQVLSCSGGASSTVACNLNSNASALECTGTATAGATSCTTIFAGQRDVADACNAPDGVYTIVLTLQSSVGELGCSQGSTTESELVTFLDSLLAPRPGCTWNKPRFDATTCALTRQGVCAESSVAQPTAMCTFSNDGTLGNCDIDDGQCVYTVELTR